MKFNITKIDDLESVLDHLEIGSSKTILIKPNWVGAMPGGFTDAKIIDYLLSALKDREVIFVESYSYWRTDKKRDTAEDYFSSKEADLETGRTHWEFFKKMDEWFLSETGIGEILKKHKARYLSTTNEIWENKRADPEKIRKCVENCFLPVSNNNLYEIIPKELLNYRGAPLISLSKMKIDSSYGASLSIKNIFGLIPDPNRFRKYHGEDGNESLLVQSIVDVHKVYQSLFDTKFITEGVFDYCEMDWESERSKKLDGVGILFAGNSGLEVDEEALTFLNRSYKGAISNLLSLYKEQIIK